MYRGMRFETEIEKKDRQRRRRAKEIMKIEDKTERYNALVEFIRPEHEETNRWSVEAVADMANAYIQARNYEDFCESNPNKRYDEFSHGFSKGQTSVLEELLCRNGWGWVVGLR